MRNIVNSPPDSKKAGIAVPASKRNQHGDVSNPVKEFYQKQDQNTSLNIGETALKLLGMPNKSLSTGREYRYGKRGSLCISLDQNVWYNFETGEGGGVISLVEKLLNCDLQEALRWMNQGNFNLPPLPKAIRPPKDNSQKATEIWNMGKSISGTLAERYLASRGILINPGANVLRFIERCPFGRDRLPCMVALFRDIFTDEITGIHRTALTPDGQKIDRKMLGRSKNAAIKLTPDENVTSGLGIAEGLETALTVIQAGWSPIWAMGAANGISDFPILPGIEALTIFADNDPAGLKAARNCAERWRFREVHIYTPPKDGADYADWRVK